MVGQISHLGLVGAADVVESEAMLGGGSLPTEKIPTWCVSIQAAGISIDKFAGKLRNATPAVIGRVSKDRLLLDMRTIAPADDIRLVEIFESLS